MHIELFLRFSYQPFNSCGVCSIIPSFTPSVSNSCLLTFFFFPVLEVYQDALIFFKEPVSFGLIDSFPPQTFSVLKSIEIATLLLIISLLQANIITLFYLLWEVMLIIFKFLQVEA